jgi:chitodextrinase/glucose/arabinose dehydrogenase
MKKNRFVARLAAGLVVFGCALAALSPNPARAQTYSDAGFASELVATLPRFTPVGLTWAPDGRMFIWQRNGIVRIFKNGALLPTPFVNISNQVNTFTDRGMLGLALHPNFAENGFVYLLFTREEAGNPNSDQPKVSRLIRVTADPANPDVALAGSEVIILGSVSTPPCDAQPAGADCIPSDSNTHSIGTLRFAPDGKLFVGSGDGAEAGGVDPKAFRSQNLDSPAGKILRINDDGTAPADNPFYDGTNSWRSKVWVYGLRNPYRFNLDPSTGDLLIGDVGWNRWEEINRGVRGRNYGWPCFEGNLPEPEYQSALPSCFSVPSSAVTFPVVTWAHDDVDPTLPGFNPNFLGSTAVGGTIYTGSAYPQLYSGSFFYADYTGGWIRRLVFDAAGNLTGNLLFSTGEDVGGLVSVEQGPDGLLYYVLFAAGEVRRIKFNGPVAKATATPSFGGSPLTVAFSSSGSLNPGGGTLTYAWDFGDGTTSTAANPTHVYTVTGVRTFVVRLTVTSNGQSSTATLSVTVGSTPPVPTISAPANGASLLPGQSVAYQGSASDPEEGPLPASALSWQVLLHHNDHIHTLINTTGTSGSFDAQFHGVGTYAYEIILTATDSSGLKGSKSVTLPVLQDTAPPSAPSGLTASALSAHQVRLAWTAATDNSGSSTYRVERCQGAGCTNFAQAGTPAGTTFDDSGLLPSTAYRYRVQAVDATGNVSPYSNIASATTQAPPATPVAAYSFNEGAGTSVADASGNGNTGTINGATWVAGKYGTALNFNGTSNLVLINHSSSLALDTGMTLEAWVMPTAAQSGWRTIMQKEVDAYFLHASGGGTPLEPTGGGTFNGALDYFAGSPALAVNTWSHVALTWDGSIMRLYINGVEAANRARTGPLASTTAPLRIGGNFPYGEYFLGRIDEVRVYDRALSTAEIQTDMNTPIGASGPDTTAPSAPSALSATAAGTQINLSWTASTDNVGVSGYRLERCQGAGCVNFAQIATPAGTTFNDVGLIASTSYSYRVRASDAAGNLSGYSAVASATTPVLDTAQPTAPSGLGASAAGAGQINLSWTASTDNVGVSGYQLERCQSTGCANFAQIATPAVASFSDNGLAGSTSYSYRVRATDAAGNLSGYSNVASATTAASTGLVAAYAFNEASGTTVADASGNGNSGTLTGATWAAGKYGGALNFNGASNVVVINNSSSLALTTRMTLEAWVMPTVAQSGWRTIMQKETDAYFLHASGGGAALAPTGGGTFNGALDYFAAPTALAVNAWSHVALTWDGSIMRLYVNGVEAANHARTGTLQSTTTPLRIGTNSPYGEFFLGLIDEVRIYNRALSAAEIQTDMNTPIGPSGPDTTAPSAPSGLGATAAGTQINLSWTASTDNVGVSGYQLERCQGTGCVNFAQIATPTSASFADTGLTAGTSYSYRVRATDAAGNLSGYSGVAGATTPTPDITPPTAPSGLAASAVSGTQINLSWTASTDNVGVSGYRLERCQGAGCTTFAQIATPTGTSFSNTGLTAGTSYSYRVRAADAAGNLSGYSNVASASTTAADTTPPTAPSGLSASAAGAGQINLSWTASTDNVGVSGYRLERCQGTGCVNFAQIATPAGASFADTGLTSGTSYSYQVRAADAAGNLSGYSNVASTTTAVADTTPPAAPSGLTAGAISGAQINLSWTASTDNVGVTGYQLERCQGAGCVNFALVATPAGTAFSDGGLAASTSYSYRVRAGDAGGNLSGYSNVVSATTAAATGLVAAYAFNEASGTTVADASGNANSGAINGATWVAGKYGGALSFNGTSNVVVINNSSSLALTNRMTLEAWVMPTAAQSGWHAIMQKEVDAYFLHASGAGAPLAPTGGGTFNGAVDYFAAPTALAVNAWSHVALTWDGSIMRLYINGVEAENKARTGTLQSTTTPLRIGGNSPYGEMFLGLIDEVRIYNRALSAAEIQTDMNTPIGPSGPDTTAPSAPSGLGATAAGTQINLSWTASTDNVGVSGYQLERCQGAGCVNFAQIATPSGTTFNDVGLIASTSYSYRVRASDAAGNLSGYSAVASATTPILDTTPPTAPSGLAASAAGGQINLSWTASTDNVGVSGYRLERCQGAGCVNFAQIATPAGTSFSDSGLAASTSYSYQVRATDGSGNLSLYSNVASATTAASTGLVAAYSFNEGTGTSVADASGNGNTGTINGGATWVVAGKYGTALSFDGTNDVVVINNSSSLALTNRMTLEAWVFPTAAQSGWRTIMQKEVDAYFLHASGNSALQPTGGGTFNGAVDYFASPTALAVNAWSHVAMTWDGSIMRLYVNGVELANHARTGTLQSTTTPLRIGGNSPYGEFFLGRIDEVRVYNRALSAAEIQTDMNTPVAP